MKKILLIFILIVFLSISAPQVNAAISPSPVQQAIASCVACSTFNAVLGGAPTNGNTLILMYAVSPAVGNAISSISQTGVSWHLATSTNSTQNQITQIYYGEVSSGASATAAVNMSAPQGGNGFANISEWSGVQTSGELDAIGTANGTSATPTTSTITPIQDREELVVAVTRSGGTFSSGPTNGFTALSTGNSAAQYVYKVIPKTIGSVSTSWTWTGSVTYSNSIASFFAPLQKHTFLMISGHRFVFTGGFNFVMR